MNAFVQWENKKKRRFLFLPGLAGSIEKIGQVLYLLEH